MGLLLGEKKMVDCKEYTVSWRYSDQHHCDFQGGLNFTDRSPEAVLEQFKKTDTWERYGAGRFPDSFGCVYFHYKIEEVKDLSSLVTDSNK